MSINVDIFKQIMAQWATGVSIVTSRLGDYPHGMTVNSFTSLSLDPMYVIFNAGKNQVTHDMISQSGIFAVNILEQNQTELGKLFAGIIPAAEDRFAGIETYTATTGAPILPGVSAWLDCRVAHAYEGGDHTIFVGEVVAGEVESARVPLLYFNRSWGTFAPEGKTGLTHIVLFRLHEPSHENLDLMRDALLGLKGKISQIRSIEVGKNIVPSERAYDLALTVRFDSLAAMQEYQVHPDHVRVLTEIIRPRAASIVAADYES